MRLEVWIEKNYKTRFNWSTRLDWRTSFRCRLCCGCNNQVLRELQLQSGNVKLTWSYVDDRY
ncbi:unnamed protein product [Trifolium pratense]|uniref:Uncharacterized protein n=1 Tax=Trifolium pratense TaxID=57577 RepID=A0ACB0J281_TRIPR|nr:unnamed protein product [Trifolium pratense]